ncbi:ribonuclease H2 subunit C [Aspergillus ambiguus]|uniref:ribonuclease H2 subunit C n=1 Tax=Aspergillus ambiguus TaxID=176160 RepID=UPI003CCD4EE8
MFALQRSPQSTSDKCTPNILPCRVHHDGPIKSVERFWTPFPDEKDQPVQTAHFRGRKLRGRRVAVPEGYEGVVAIPTERVIPSKGADNDDSAPEEPIKVLEQQSTFVEVMVWGHEITPAPDDPFVKGVEEWIKLAEAMHTQPSDQKQQST